MINIKRLFNRKVYLSEEEIKWKTSQLYPLIGYLWLIFTFVISYTSNLIPFQMFNAEWELETIRKIINIIWAPVIGFCLVFFTRQREIKLIEKKILGLLSWLPLVMAILYLATLPLIFTDVNRIKGNIEMEFNRQWEITNNQFVQIEEQLKQASPKEIEAFINNQPKTAKTDPNLSTEEKKKVYIYKIEAQKKALYDQAKKELINKQNQQDKQVIYLGIGAVIASALMYNIWRFSDWTRELLL